MFYHAAVLAVSFLAASISVRAVCSDGQIGITRNGLDSFIVANDCGSLDEKPVNIGIGSSNVCDHYVGGSEVSCVGDPFDNNVDGIELFDGTFWGNCLSQGGASACGGNIITCCSPLA